VRSLRLWSPMKSSFTSISCGDSRACAASLLRNGEPTLPVCTARGILSDHESEALSLSICG
jgi:hypothetical protein